MKSPSGDDAKEEKDGDAHAFFPNQTASWREGEREKERAMIATADKSSCLHISIYLSMPSMYDTTIERQQ